MSDREGERESSSDAFARWMSQADENIEKWGLQDEETLLLAIQEELGELTQAYLEARAEDGDPSLIDEELDDLGALLLQLHERRQQPELRTDGGRRDTEVTCKCCGIAVESRHGSKIHNTCIDCAKAGCEYWDPDAVCQASGQTTLTTQ